MAHLSTKCAALKPWLTWARNAMHWRGSPEHDMRCIKIVAHLSTKCAALKPWLTWAAIKAVTGNLPNAGRRSSCKRMKGEMKCLWVPEISSLMTVAQVRQIIACIKPKRKIRKQRYGTWEEHSLTGTCRYEVELISFCRNVSFTLLILSWACRSHPGWVLWLLHAT